MHITYDLPVSINDILEAKQRLAGKYIKRVCRARIILANAARGNIS
jgi:threonine dehydratase